MHWTRECSSFVECLQSMHHAQSTGFHSQFYINQNCNSSMREMKTETYSLLFIWMVLPSTHFFLSQKQEHHPEGLAHLSSWMILCNRGHMCLPYISVSSHVCLHSGLLFPMLYLDCFCIILLVSLILVLVSAQLLCEVKSVPSGLAVLASQVHAFLTLLSTLSYTNSLSQAVFPVSVLTACLESLLIPLSCVFSCRSFKQLSPIPFQCLYMGLLYSHSLQIEAF